MTSQEIERGNRIVGYKAAEMDVAAKNRIIAEFMGGEWPHSFAKDYVVFEQIDFGDMGGSYGCYEKDLHFDSSWSWLMPVVEKIEQLDWNINILRQTTDIYDIDFRFTGSGKCFNGKKNTKINSVYSAVLQFLEWYNSQQVK